MKILLKVTGSVSLYKMGPVVSFLKKRGHQVKVAASKNSLKFVGAATWEALSGEQVYVDDFDPNRRLDHIYLNDWADIVVLAPASAKTLNELSNAVGESVINTLFLARDSQKPYIIFPAMNPRMWQSESVQSSVEKLRSLNGVKLITPEEGYMACGHEGVGRLPEPEKILDVIYGFFTKQKKILVTFGGTVEDIDGVRNITNFSTGNTGMGLCNSLMEGFNITALINYDLYEKAKKNLYGVNLLTFKDSKSLQELMFSKLKEESYDFVIHLAAVSDFILAEKFSEKISSKQTGLELKLIKNTKILNEIKENSKNKKMKLISFKLTRNQIHEEVLNKIKKQIEESLSDFVVHNELKEINLFNHPFKIYSKENLVSEGKTKKDLYTEIQKICEG